VSDENDILQKADALLHRRDSRHEPDFPVLTEVVDKCPPSLHSQTASVTNIEELVEPHYTITRIEFEELEHRILGSLLPAMELQLAESIRSSLLPQISAPLEHSIKTVAEDVSRSMTSRVAEQLSDTIKATIQTELSKLRSRIPDL